MKRKPMTYAVAILIAVTIVGLAPVLTARAASGPAFDLKFAGVITAAPAQPGDPWQIGGQTVTVNALTRIRLSTDTVAPGMWADVTAKRQLDDSLLALQIVVMPPEIRLKGPISAMPADGIGAWIVAGQVIQVTTDTKISQRGGVLDVGAWAEVYAVEDPIGTLTATRIRGIEVQEDIEVYGAIQVCSDAACTLSAVPLVVNSETLISEDPQVGLLAHASAALQDDGTLLALTLKVEWQEPGGARPQVQIVGTVQSLPAQDLNGIWVVEGQEVVVTASTVIVQVKGLVEVGAHVQVLGWPAAGKIIASQVTVLSSPSGGGQSFHIWGLVESMPGNGVLGTWTIAGQQVEVTRQTRLHGAEQIRLGEPVEAGGLQLQAGVRVATWLRTRTQGGPGPQPSMTPQPSHTPSVTPEPSHTPSGTPGVGPQPTHTPGGGPGPTRTPGNP
jgi:hypothetical protein